MRSLNVGALPVVEGQQLVGMITDRDLTIRADIAAESGKKDIARTVKEVSTTR